MRTTVRGPRGIRGLRGTRDTLRACALLVLLPLSTARPTTYASPAVDGLMPSQRSEVVVDWTNGMIRANAELELASSGLRLPSGRAEAENRLESMMPDLVREVVLGIELDSWRTVAESLDDGTLDPAAFEDFLENGTRTRSTMSRDLKTLVATFEWELSRLGALYVRHSVPIDLPSASAYVPTKPYTGIVVYIKGEYAVRGEHRTDQIHPCVFPRLFDEAMTPILERNLMQPEALRAWGAVAYATSLDDPVVEARAGGAPLRVVASSIFGSRRTDAVLRVDDALKILGSAENRELIRSGKVVFVIDDRYL
ncbi:MAG: hypothetical protein JXM71_08475 [Spirochaetales bacterium]|nr:hypothetical protein [Spirochaetales bacterium]